MALLWLTHFSCSVTQHSAWHGDFHVCIFVCTKGNSISWASTLWLEARPPCCQLLSWVPTFIYFVNQGKQLERRQNPNINLGPSESQIPILPLKKTGRWLGWGGAWPTELQDRRMTWVSRGPAAGPRRALAFCTRYHQALLGPRSAHRGQSSISMGIIPVSSWKQFLRMILVTSCFPKWSPNPFSTVSERVGR